MSNDSLKFAISRLDRATARVERMIAEGRPAITTTSGAAVPLLIEQHEQLRQTVRTAIGRIDALIASPG